MKIKLSLCVLLLSIGCMEQTNRGVANLEVSSPAAEHMSAERLMRIDQMINSAIEEDEIPGAVALIARNGRIVYHKAFGTTNPSTGREYRTDDIFRIASQTKAITATAVMILWEEGKFRLDDPISKYIPEFKNPQLLDSFVEADTTYTTTAADKEISIRHLITHTSGIGYSVIDEDDRIRKIYAKSGTVNLFTTEAVTIEDNVKKLSGLPLHHNPGDGWTYSEGLDVLGYFIEVVSGMPLDQFLKERIFDPLEMNDTYFYLPEEKYDRLVPVQTWSDNQWALYSDDLYDVDFPKKGAKSYFSGGAGLNSTAEDYARFLQMYLNKGEYNGQRLLSRTTIQTIMSNQIFDHWGNSGAYYGLAFGVVDEIGQALGGRGSVGTFDWGGYFNTSFFADPVENTIGILLKQTRKIEEDNTGWRFRQMVGNAIDD